MSEKEESKKITVMPKTKNFDITNMNVSSLISEFNVPKLFMDMIGQFMPTKFGIDMPKFNPKNQSLVFGVYANDAAGNRKLVFKLHVSFAEKPKHKIVFSTDGEQHLHQITYEYVTNNEISTK